MLNKVQLIGRLGNDAKSKEVGDKTVTDFQIATDETWKDAKGEKQSKTEWHSCSMWGNKNLVPYLTKGSQIYVEGKLRHDSYEKDGATVYSTKVVVDEVKLINTKDKPEAA